MTSKWPKDNQAALIAFYGDPGTGQVAHQLVSIVPPFQMYYDKKPMKPNRLLVHQKCAGAFQAAFQKIWDYYGHDQALMNKLHVTWSSGTYAPRRVRGSNTKWSNHAYGAAWDVDAEDNPLASTKNKLPLPVVAAFKSEGARWGGDYKNRKDNMHVEFCDGGQPQKSFAEWLEIYQCPPMGTYPMKDGVAPAPTPSPQPIPDWMDKKPPVVTVDPNADDGLPPKGKYSVETEVVQKQLCELGYRELGEVDGKWGGKTTGAIAAFYTDRGITHEALIDSFLKAEISKAANEKWTRPIAAARKDATEAEVAQKVPELAPVRQNKFLTFFGAIGAVLASIFSALMDNFKDALDWLTPVKDFFVGVPGWVWFAAAALVAGYIAWNSMKGATGIKTSFNSGARS